MGLKSAIRLITNLTSRYDKLNAAATLFVGKAKEGVTEADALEKEWAAVKAEIAGIIAGGAGGPRRIGVESGRLPSADPNAAPTDPTLVNLIEPSSGPKSPQIITPPIPYTGTSRVPAEALPVSPAIYVPPDYSEAAQQAREQRAGGWNQAAADDIVAKLIELKARLERVFGGPVYITQLIDQEIRNIQAKVLTPDEALAFMRYVLSTMAAGLQQEALSPVSGIRDVANDLLRFAGGGALPGAGAQFTTLPVGPSPTPATPSPAPTTVAATVAGIGPAVASAVRSEVSGLGATINRQEQVQGDRIVASIGLAATQIHSAVNTQATTLRTIQESATRANRDLAEQFQHIQGWQRRAEDEYLRPTQENTVRANRALAEGFRELGRNQLSPQALRDELERLNISGRLGVS